MCVYIKGMEMPRWCEECPCMSEVDVVQGTACGCKLTMKIREIDNDKRPTWCPLVPVPPHGRLIDVDALAKEDNRLYSKYRKDNGLDDLWHRAIQNTLEAAPIVTPASKEET